MDFSDISDLSQVIIALANLFLAGYLIFYQIRKDRRSEFQTAKLNEQNIKLQWFKELIVQPNLQVIDSFYSNLLALKGKITSDSLTKEEKEKINAAVKAELSIIRKSFVDVLHQVDKPFGDKIMKNLDELIDSFTNAIFNEELKLTMIAVYDKEIGSKIFYSKNNLIALLYNYMGLSY